MGTGIGVIYLLLKLSSSFQRAIESCNEPQLGDRKWKALSFFSHLLSYLSLKMPRLTSPSFFFFFSLGGREINLLMIMGVPITRFSYLFSPLI